MRAINSESVDGTRTSTSNKYDEKITNKIYLTSKNVIQYNIYYNTTNHGQCLRLIEHSGTPDSCHLPARHCCQLRIVLSDSGVAQPISKGERGRYGLKRWSDSVTPTVSLNCRFVSHQYDMQLFKTIVDDNYILINKITSVVS